jgi:hypothetical protein
VSEVGISDHIGFFSSGYDRKYVFKLLDLSLHSEFIMPYIMEIEQMMQQLLANQEKAEANRKADQVKVDGSFKEMKAEMKTYQEMLARMEANMNAWL